jgi:hypothetical protein
MIDSLSEALSFKRVGKAVLDRLRAVSTGQASWAYRLWWQEFSEERRVAFYAWGARTLKMSMLSAKSRELRNMAALLTGVAVVDALLAMVAVRSAQVRK